MKTTFLTLHLLLFSALFFPNNNLSAYSPADFLDTARQSRNAAEDFSSWVSRHSQVFPFLKDYGSDENGKFADFFYSFHRGYFTDFYELQGGMSFFSHPSEPYEISQRELKMIIKLGSHDKDGNFNGIAGSLMVKSMEMAEIETIYGEEMESILADAGYSLMAATLYYHGIMFSYGIVNFMEFETMISADQTKTQDPKSYHFIDSNIFSTFYFQIDEKESYKNPNNFKTSLELFNLLQLSQLPLPARRSLLPDLQIGYRYSENASLDQSVPARIEKTLFFDLDYQYYKGFYLKSRMEIFLNTPSPLLNNYIFQECYWEIGINHYISQLFSSQTPSQYYNDDILNWAFYYLVFGVSFYTDERLITYGSDSQQVWGYKIGFQFSTIKGIKAQLYYGTNYSPDLRNFIEVYDHKALSFSISLFF